MWTLFRRTPLWLDPCGRQEGKGGWTGEELGDGAGRAGLSQCPSKSRAETDLRAVCPARQSGEGGQASVSASGEAGWQFPKRGQQLSQELRG